MSAELEAALAKLSARNGDIVFYDRDLINVEDIIQIQSPSPECDGVIFVPINTRGKSVRESIELMTRELVQELLRDAGLCVNCATKSSR